MPRKSSSENESVSRNIRRKAGKFELRIARRGHAPINKLFDTLKEAEAERGRILSDIRDGKAPPNIRARVYTVSDAIDEYKRYLVQQLLIKQKSKPASSIGEIGKSGNASAEGAETQPDDELEKMLPSNKRSSLNRLKDDIGHLKVLQLNHRGLAGYLNQKGLEEVAPPSNKRKSHPLYEGGKTHKRAESTVRKYFYDLKTALEWHAVQHDYDLPRNLFDHHEVPAAWSGARQRRLENDEEKRLLAACDRMYVKKEEWKRIIRFALETAMRTQEILYVTWADLNLEQRYINIPAHIVKTRTARQVPLTKTAVEIIEAHAATRMQSEQRIFWQWKNSNVLGHAFKRITKNAEITDLKFHDLRHEAISRFFERTTLGVMEIASITGHGDTRTLKRYTHLRPQLMAEKLDGEKKITVEMQAEELAAYEQWKQEQAKKQVTEMKSG